MTDTFSANTETRSRKSQDLGIVATSESLLLIEDVYHELGCIDELFQYIEDIPRRQKAATNSRSTLAASLGSLFNSVVQESSKELFNKSQSLIEINVVAATFIILYSACVGSVLPPGITIITQIDKGIGETRMYVPYLKTPRSAFVTWSSVPYLLPHERADLTFLSVVSSGETGIFPSLTCAMEILSNGGWVEIAVPHVSKESFHNVKRELRRLGKNSQTLYPKLNHNLLKTDVDFLPYFLAEHSAYDVTQANQKILAMTTPIHKADGSVSGYIVHIPSKPIKQRQSKDLLRSLNMYKSVTEPGVHNVVIQYEAETSSIRNLVSKRAMELAAAELDTIGKERAAIKEICFTLRRQLSCQYFLLFVKEGDALVCISDILDMQGYRLDKRHPIIRPSISYGRIFSYNCPRFLTSWTSWVNTSRDGLHNMMVIPYIEQHNIHVIMLINKAALPGKAYSRFSRYDERVARDFCRDCMNELQIRHNYTFTGKDDNCEDNLSSDKEVTHAIKDVRNFDERLDDQMTGAKIQCWDDINEKQWIEDYGSHYNHIWWFYPFEVLEMSYLAPIKYFFHYKATKPLIDLAICKRFFYKVSCSYNSSSPYHNLFHAVQVTHACYKLMSESYKYQDVESKVMCTRPLSDLVDDLDLFALFSAAICHDIDHPAVTNQYLINVAHIVAIIYNDRAVLENYHSAFVYRHILSAQDSNITSLLTKDQQLNFRSMFIRSILATDMNMHGEYMVLINERVDKHFNGSPLNKGTEGDKSLIIEAILKLADITNPGIMYPSVALWGAAITEEFAYQNKLEESERLPITMFMSGLDVKSAKANMLKNFANFIVLPMLTGVGRLLPQVQELKVQVTKNIALWDFVEKYFSQREETWREYYKGLGSIDQRLAKEKYETLKTTLEEIPHLYCIESYLPAMGEFGLPISRRRIKVLSQYESFYKSMYLTSKTCEYSELGTKSATPYSAACFIKKQNGETDIYIDVRNIFSFGEILKPLLATGHHPANDPIRSLNEWPHKSL